MTPDRNHLDAETVAAWMDGGLDAVSVAAAEAHASTCERCQALLATVARTLPATQLAPGSKPARGTFFSWWLAPIAATAAAVTLWMVVPQTPMQAPPTESLARDAAKPQPPAAPTEAPAPAATPPQPTRDGTLADSRRNVPAPANEEKARVADADAQKLDAVAGARKDQQAKREENTFATETRQVAEPQAAADRAAQAERLREAQPAAAPPAAPAITQLRKQIATPVIVSPDTNSRWRTITQGTVERSEDGGRTWIPVRVAAGEEVLAGASPGPLACWLVGRGGLVLLATDGTNFTRLPFPEPVDLVSVSSPQTRIATVTTADGRTFGTQDAGRSWRQQ